MPEKAFDDESFHWSEFLVDYELEPSGNTGTDALPAVLQDRLRRQVAVWRRDLLTLDRRQRLIYFAHTRTRT